MSNFVFSCLYVRWLYLERVFNLYPFWLAYQEYAVQKWWPDPIFILVSEFLDYWLWFSLGVPVDGRKSHYRFCYGSVSCCSVWSCFLNWMQSFSCWDDRKRLFQLSLFNFYQFHKRLELRWFRTACLLRPNWWFVPMLKWWFVLLDLREDKLHCTVPRPNR